MFKYGRDVNLAMRLYELSALGNGSTILAAC